VREIVVLLGIVWRAAPSSDNLLDGLIHLVSFLTLAVVYRYLLIIASLSSLSMTSMVSVFKNTPHVETHDSEGSRPGETVEMYDLLQYFVIAWTLFSLVYMWNVNIRAVSRINFFLQRLFPAAHLAWPSW